MEQTTDSPGVADETSPRQAGLVGIEPQRVETSEKQNSSRLGMVSAHIWRYP